MPQQGVDERRLGRGGVSDDPDVAYVLGALAIAC